MLLEVGVTPEELWKEVIRRMPELEPIIKGKDDYIQAEMKKIEEFGKGEIKLLTCKPLSIGKGHNVM